MTLVLLAPVPERHLESAVALRADFIALGARDERPFDKLDAEGMGKPIPILFYASHQRPGSDRLARHAATWAGTYVGRVRAVAGRHPEETLYRPETTRTDRLGKWKFFYHVKDLRRLDAAEEVEIAALRSCATKRPYKDARVRKPRLALK